MQRAPQLGMDPWSADDRPVPRRCEHPDCAEEGVYRAPKARDRLTEYFWFCLEHVRDYNRRWDYFAGMNEQEIERHRRRDTVWERPTWRLGERTPRGAYIDPSLVRDFFHLFDDEHVETPRREQQAPRRSAAEEEALAVFALEAPVTLSRVKARYKELVKLHHPDTNGGDKAAEERLKIINQAYTTLKSGVLA